MKDIRRVCIDSLIELAKTTELVEITVLKLIEHANVKRATFYYSFTSIRDVIRCYFLEYPLLNTLSIENTNQLTVAIKKRLDRDKQFSRALINQKIYRDVIQEVVFEWTQLYFRKRYSKALTTFFSGGFCSCFLEDYVGNEETLSQVSFLFQNSQK